MDNFLYLMLYKYSEDPKSNPLKTGQIKIPDVL